jgi:2-haloacid dehalogenase
VGDVRLHTAYRTVARNSCRATFHPRRGSAASLTPADRSSAQLTANQCERRRREPRARAKRSEGQAWATFDCYGTLVDWDSGIASVVGDDLLATYHEVEPQVQLEQPTLSYREVMREVLRRLDFADVDALARSLPGWPVFPEVPDALESARERGWKLAILSNTDRDFIEASMTSIDVPFDLAIVASEIGSYKPGLGHWRAFEERIGRLPDVHVAASRFHDVVPATKLGIPTLWINRRFEIGEPRPTRELPNLERLADTLDEL